MKKNRFLLEESIFKENDIRGKYPQQVNERVSFILGKVFISFVKKIYHQPLRLLVGYDNRHSSPSLARSFIEGALLGNPHTIINIKESTTPLFYFSMKKARANAGVMITASHNPYSENGFLFFLKNGISFLSGKKWDKKFYKAVTKEFNKHERYGNKEKEKAIKAKIVYLDFKKEYLSFLLKFLKIEKPLKFILDDGGGSVGLILKELLKKEKNKLLELYLIKEKKCYFVDPQQEKKKLSKIKKEIIKRRANGGVVFDSDADRAIFLDEKAKIIDPARIFGFLTINFLKDYKNAEFTTTEFLNLKIKEKIEKLRGKLIYSPTGYGVFHLKTKREKALFGSEHTGHYYYRLFDYHDDGLLTLIFVLNGLSRSNKIFSQINEEFQTNPSCFVNFKSTPSNSIAIIKLLEKIALKYKKKSFENLKIRTKKWLMIWRISGTSNLLRVYLEKI